MSGSSSRSYGHFIYAALASLFQEAPGSEIILPDPGTYYKWSNSTVGQQSAPYGVIADSANDRLLVAKKGGGNYLINYNASIEIDPNQCFGAALFKNGVLIPSTIQRQTSPEPARIHADSISLVVGDLVTGSIDNLKIQDGVFYEIAEKTGIPGFSLLMTFTDGEALSDIFEFIGDYDGSASHQVKGSVYNNTGTIFDNFTLFDADFASLPSIQYKKRFTFPGTLSDYYNNDKEVIIKIEHETSGNTNHRFYMDEIAIVRRKSILNISASDIIPLSPGDYIDLRFFCPANSQTVIVKDANLNIIKKYNS